MDYFHTSNTSYKLFYKTHALYLVIRKLQRTSYRTSQSLLGCSYLPVRMLKIIHQFLTIFELTGEFKHPPIYNDLCITVGLIFTFTRNSKNTPEFHGTFDPVLHDAFQSSQHFSTPKQVNIFVYFSLINQPVVGLARKLAGLRSYSLAFEPLLCRYITIGGMTVCRPSKVGKVSTVPAYWKQGHCISDTATLPAMMQPAVTVSTQNNNNNKK